MDPKTITWIIVIVAFIYFYKKAAPKKSKRTSAAQKPSRNDLPEWLLQRWQAHAGGEAGFPDWHDDKPSQGQIDKLKEYDVTPTKRLTKGAASDIIGLHYPADEDDIELAKFFKRNRRNLCQTEGREIARQVSNAPDMLSAWQNRPPNALEKAMLKHYGLKITKDTTRTQALTQLEDAETTQQQRDAWAHIEDAYTEFADPDTRIDYDIKKPTPNQVATATKAVIAKGEDPDDFDLIAEALTELYPSLEKD